MQRTIKSAGFNVICYLLLATTKISVCVVGYFGPECDNLCHCKRQSPCDRKTGICPDGCEQHSTGKTCNTSNIQNQYIGCYGDSGKNDAMDVKNPNGKSNRYNNSNEFCIQICSSRNFTYAGMEYKEDCNCGEKYNRYGNKTPRGELVNCKYPCPAQPTQKCGGDYANSVYYVCPISFYGPGCVKRCHCSDGGPCRFNGSCLISRTNSCKLGWTESQCNIRDCETRNGDCESDEICETIDLRFANLSICRCKDGSYRDNNTCRPTHLQYVGCFVGNVTQYISVDLPAKHMLTIEFCIQSCKELNKTYSVIQGGSECVCGGDYGRMLPDAECQVPCPGNTLQYCGGKNTLDGTPIYVVYTG